MTKAAQLRGLIAKGAVAMPGVPNAAMARQVERAGFDALYISGAGLANSTAGLPDIGLLSLTEVAMLAGFIAHAVKIPAIVDAGYGFRRRGKISDAPSMNWKPRDWPVVTSKTRNFRSVAVTWPASGWSTRKK